MGAPDRIAPLADAARQVFTVRASSWGSLFNCAHAWEGAHILGLKKPAGLRAHLGTSIHASTAAFDSGRLPGGAAPSADDTAEVFVRTLHQPDRDIDYHQDDLTVSDAERIGLTLHTRYCLDIAPRFQYLSVEQKLQPLDIDCGGGLTVRLTGTMDRARVAQAAAGVVIPDVKTGGRVISDGRVVTKGRAAQLGTYQLMYERDPEHGRPTAGGQVIGLLTSKTAMKPGPRDLIAGVSPVFDAKRVMVGTDDTPGLIEHAAAMFRTGLFPPNPQATTCAEKYCARWATCPFHD